MARKRSASQLARSTMPESRRRGRSAEDDSSPGVEYLTTLPAPAVTYEWCVDHEGRIAPMRLVDLWTALSTGEVAPSSRVWREGMECWTPAALVPDVAFAIPEAALAATPSPCVVEAAPLPSDASRALASFRPPLPSRPRGPRFARARVWAGAAGALLGVALAVMATRYSRTRMRPIEPLYACMSSAAAAVIAAVPPPDRPTEVGDEANLASASHPTANVLAQVKHVERGQKRRRR